MFYNKVIIGKGIRQEDDHKRNAHAVTREHAG